MPGSNRAGRVISSNAKVLKHLLDLAKTMSVRIVILIYIVGDGYLGSINVAVPQH